MPSICCPPAAVLNLASRSAPLAGGQAVDGTGDDDWEVAFRSAPLAGGQAVDGTGDDDWEVAFRSAPLAGGQAADGTGDEDWEVVDKEDASTESVGLDSFARSITISRSKADVDALDRAVEAATAESAPGTLAQLMFGRPLLSDILTYLTMCRSKTDQIVGNSGRVANILQLPNLTGATVRTRSPSVLVECLLSLQCCVVGDSAAYEVAQWPAVFFVAQTKCPPAGMGENAPTIRCTWTLQIASLPDRRTW